MLPALEIGRQLGEDAPMVVMVIRMFIRFILGTILAEVALIGTAKLLDFSLVAAVLLGLALGVVIALTALLPSRT